jgi:hypothetical protein
MTLVLDVLFDDSDSNHLSTEVEIPEQVLDSFGKSCSAAGLLNAEGLFDDPYKLVQFFVQPLRVTDKRKK